MEESNLNFKVIAAVMGVASGLLAGFSVSPVVGGVISSIVAAAFVVLSIAPDSSKVSLEHRRVRAIPYFVLPLVLALGLGAYARTHHLFLPSPMEIDFLQMQAIGVDPASARSAITAKYIGTEGTGETTGLNAMPSNLPPDGADLAPLMQANYNTIHSIATYISSTPDQAQNPDLVNIQLNAKSVAVFVRSLLETRLGEGPALIWYRLQLAPPSEFLRLEEQFLESSPSDLTKLNDFLGR